MSKTYILYIRALVALGILCAGVMAAPAQGASFDCAKAKTKVEHMICDNPELSKLDDELGRAFQAAMKYRERAPFIRRGQSRWLQMRNQCTNDECMKRLYEMQLLILQPIIPRVNVAPTNALGSSGAASATGTTPKEGFRLVKGKGKGICDEYQKDLDSLRNPLNLYWQINPKFPKLKQPDFGDFVYGGDIYSEMYELVWNRDTNPAYLVDQTFWRGTREEYKEAKDIFFHDRSNFAFDRRLVKVDIDNDGIPDNVILAVFCGRCGYLMFVANDQLSGLDYAKTALVFRHPTVAERGILRPYQSREWKLPLNVASSEADIVTDSLHATGYGIVTYEGKNYFFMLWNDPVLEGSNGYTSSGIDYRATRLYMFLAEKQDVTEVCTYQYVTR